MSTACLELKTLGLTPVGTNRAFTEEGSQLSDKVVQALESLRTSETVGAPVQARRLALDEAFRECSEANWDGYGADPANELSVEWAGYVLESLPADTPAPDIAFDPHGDVLLEWQSANGGLMSVGIGTAGEVRFAIRTPTTKLTGIEVFTDGVPPQLAHALETFAG